jgi:hypothetical protein
VIINYERDQLWTEVAGATQFVVNGLDDNILDYGNDGNTYIDHGWLRTARGDISGAPGMGVAGLKFQGRVGDSIPYRIKGGAMAPRSWLFFGFEQNQDQISVAAIVDAGPKFDTVINVPNLEGSAWEGLPIVFAVGVETDGNDIVAAGISAQCCLIKPRQYATSVR